MGSRSGRARRPRALVLALLVSAAVAASGGVAGAEDRLERFRELALRRLGPVAMADADSSPESDRELYALLDEEIVESLATGGIFASPEFLQDRLDGFAETWGALSLRITRAGRLLVGAFQLHDAGRPGSVRIYGRLRDEAALLTAMSREGRPSVHPLPAAPQGGAQLLVAWEGPPSGRGTRAVRFDLVREAGDGTRVVWSTADLFAEGLLGRSWDLKGGQLRVRYEVQYPGWTPGCEGQTEMEDVFRLGPTGSVGRVARQQHNAWHRDVRAAAARLFEALAARAPAALVALVPDRELRRRLPAGLAPEPACDAVEGSGPDRVSVAATRDGTPWQLTFQRSDGRWRLTAASPVIP